MRHFPRFQLTPRCLLEPLRKLASCLPVPSSFFSFRYCSGATLQCSQGAVSQLGVCVFD